MRDGHHLKEGVSHNSEVAATNLPFAFSHSGGLTRDSAYEHRRLVGEYAHYTSKFRVNIAPRIRGYRNHLPDCNPAMSILSVILILAAGYILGGIVRMYIDEYRRRWVWKLLKQLEEEQRCCRKEDTGRT
jgi:hypothetical protein